MAKIWILRGKAETFSLRLLKPYDQRWSQGHYLSGQRHKKNTRPRTNFSRADPFEAKDWNARGQGLQNVFSRLRTSLRTPPLLMNCKNSNGVMLVNLFLEIFSPFYKNRIECPFKSNQIGLKILMFFWCSRLALRNNSDATQYTNFIADASLVRNN